MTAAAPERARWPRLAAAPHPLLRPLLPRGYAGFTQATTPRHLVEQLREMPNWRQRFALMDQFLLRRMAGGPRP